MKSTDDRGLFATLIASAASSGNVSAIPSTQTTAGNGEASIALGFPPETFIARSAGGVPPNGADMNGFLNLFSRALRAVQTGFFGQFDSGFAQSIGGYPSGAVVAGSTVGTFWVSTADDNTSTPGASGAAWQSLFSGYATQSWSNSAFVKNNNGSSGGIVSADMDDSGVPAFLSGTGVWYQVQLKGNYVASSAITSGASGDLQILGAYYSNAVSAPYLAGYNSSGTSTNYILATQGWASGQFATLASLSSTNQTLNTNTQNLQTSINGKVDTSTYVSDFYTSDSRVINLPYGHRIQAFTVPNVVNSGSGTNYVTFPVSFSGVPIAVVANTSQNGDMDVWTYNWSSTQFAINIPSGSNSSNMTVSIIAIGPK